MTFVPHFEIVSASDEADRIAYVLHGILGRGRNWRSFARMVVKAHPQWKLVLIDQRFHGDSGPAPEPHTVAACANDLTLLHGVLGPPDVVIGHSFGGKVTLAYAAEEPLDGYAVLDAVPGIPEETQTPENNDVLEVIAALRQVDVPADSRTDVRDQLRDMGLSETLVRWLSTSLKREDGQWTWVYDLDAIEAMITDYFHLDLYPVLEETTAPAVVVRTTRSDRWTDDDLERLDGLPDRVDVVPLEAGHWVQVDAPDALLSAIEPLFSE